MTPRPGDPSPAEFERQAASFPALSVSETQALIHQAHAEPNGPAATRLVEHNLRVAWEVVTARPDGGEVALADLFQEAVVALTVAVVEYAEHEGPAAGLDHYLRRVIGVHLDAMEAGAITAREADEAVARDANELQDAEIALRLELGRSPTLVELAAHLEWSTRRTAFAQASVNAAREIWDEEIVQYLDDEPEGDVDA